MNLRINSTKNSLIVLVLTDSETDSGSDTSESYNSSIDSSTDSTSSLSSDSLLDQDYDYDSGVTQMSPDSATNSSLSTDSEHAILFRDYYDEFQFDFSKGFKK